jgi:FkbH-like protein
MTLPELSADAQTQPLASSGMPQPGDKRSIKCVIWDLDNTLWSGVLMEDREVVLSEEVVGIVQALDSRGILQSVASKNDYELALAQLRTFGLDDYFLYPQISWNSKVESIKTTAASLNIGLEAIAFIDDQPFERDEVKFSLPEVLCFDAADLGDLLDRPELMPRFITEDSKRRRLMYLSDIKRNQAEGDFVGPAEAFLATLQMVFTIAAATENDLQRAEELTVRTHQLNTTGYTYSYAELDYFRQSPNHRLLIAGLDDAYGTYGQIGLALVECQPSTWTIKLLLMSCRVMSRGVGTLLLNHIMQLAKDANVSLLAEFVSNNRNRTMYVTYKFAGFKEIEKKDALVILQSDLAHIQPLPDYVKVRLSP